MKIRKILTSILLLLTSFSFLFSGNNTNVSAQDGFIWGVNGHPMKSEVYTHPWPKGIDFSTQFKLIKDLGAINYRFQIKTWQDNIPSGQSIFYYTDQFVDSALKNDINLTAILSPKIDFDGADNILPQDQTSFEKLLLENYQKNYEWGAQYGEHYNGKINFWQLGNEVFDLKWPVIQSKASPYNRISHAASNSGTYVFYNEPTQIIQASLKGLNDGIKSKNQNGKTILQSSWINLPAFQRMVTNNDSIDPYCKDLVRNDFKSNDFHSTACRDNEKYDVISADIAGWFWYSDMDGNLGARFQNDNKKLLFDTIASLGKDIWIVESNIKNGTCSKSELEMSSYLDSSVKFFQTILKVKAYFAYELLDEPYYLNNSGSSCEEGNYGLVKVIKVDGKWQTDGLKSAYSKYACLINPQSCIKPLPEKNTVPETNDRLVIKKSSDVATAKKNDVITYTIEITNPTSTTFSPIVFNDKIPKGTNYVRGSAKKDPSSTALAEERKIIYSRRTLVWEIDKIEPGKSVKLLFKVKVSRAK